MTAEAVAVTQQLSGRGFRRLRGRAGALPAERDEHLRHPEAGVRPRRGCYVWDADGRKHLDLLSGLAVTALGHAHPTVLSAITGQIATLGHVSNFFATPAQVALAERLTAMVGAPGAAKVFFTNSGTEANEAAFKITRATGRTKIIATEGAFHGRSMGALAITHNPKYREPFDPLPGDVVFVPYGDADALAAAVDDETAAVVLEPIQGENGIVVPPADYLARARDICDTTRCPALDRRGADRHGPHRQLAGARRPGRHGRRGHRWPRGWATASPSAPAWPSDGPRSCSVRAVTAAPSAATRWRRSPVSRSSR